MSESLFSTSWHRVAPLKLRLREAVAMSRHVYRSQPWYVLTNRLTGTSHRFNAASYLFIGQLDGQRTVQDIWNALTQLEGAELPTQDACIRLLSQLHEAELLQSDILPSTLAMIRSRRQELGHRWQQQLTNPLYFRLPLWNPDRLLAKWQPLLAPCFTRAALLLWTLIVGTAAVLAALHWQELSSNWTDRLLSSGNLVFLWMLYPLMKVLHELGHAFAVKQWGGEVHEMGLSLMAFTPLPYVDASASSTFADKWQRIGVAAMGMMVELLLASLALLVWLQIEAGLIRTIAFNILFLGGISTLLCNGNPLLRYDGYYILADLLEIPNLWQRSHQYLGYLLKRFLLGETTASSPVTAPGEACWFLLYGPLAFGYRLLALVGLVWLISQRFFVIGLALALWGGLTLVVLPAARVLTGLLFHPSEDSRRIRLSTGALLLGLGLVLFALPIPLWTSTEGVVWLPEQSVLRAGSNCEIVAILATPDQIVAKDTPLIQGRDPFIEAQVGIFRARLQELIANYDAQPVYQRIERKIILDAIKQVEGDLKQAEEKREKLMVRSPLQGRFVLLNPQNLPGHFVKQGDMLGYVLAEEPPLIRAVISQADIGLVRERLTGATIRLAERPGETIGARVQRLVPGADFNLPSAALGLPSGGKIPVDPSDPKGLRVLNAIFQLDLVLPETAPTAHVGGRVYVRLEHGLMPLGWQWCRSLQQLLLRRLYD